MVGSRDGGSWSPARRETFWARSPVGTSPLTWVPTHLSGGNGVVSCQRKVLMLTQHFHGKDLCPGFSQKSPAPRVRGFRGAHSKCREHPGRAAPRGGSTQHEGFFQVC